MKQLKRAIQALKKGMLLVVLGVLTSSAFAETVTHKIESLNLVAQAEFAKGDPSKPAILIMHGFLTTNQFHTIQSMAQGFKDEGYSVLTPTLTLGISFRKQSVKCNSIHTHTLENDLVEIEAWIKWLESQGKHEIVVIGHSSGSQELLAMLNHKPQPSVKLAVFTSLFYLNGPELGTLQKELNFAKDMLEVNDLRPHKYSFLFCKKDYYATPQSFLSYHRITREYVLNELKNLSIPNYTIMGEADKRYQSVGLNWLDELEQTGTNLVIINGANHFFSSEYEFDLQDTLIKIIHKNMSK